MGEVTVRRMLSQVTRRGRGVAVADSEERDVADHVADERAAQRAGRTAEQPAGETNWAGNLIYRARAVRRPESLDALREELGRPGPKRMIGSRHCFNDIADTTGTLISLERMPRLLEIGEDMVRVGGGMRYGDVAEQLHARGRALSNLASLPHISVAGAVATGTHGSGDAVGGLAAAVRAVEILTPAGELRRFERGERAFDGAVVSLGALGAVVAVELDTEPAYEVAQTVYEQPRWEAVLADLDAATSLGYSVSIFSSWRDVEVADQMWVKAKVEPGAATATAADPAVLEALGVRPADGRRHPVPGGDVEATSLQGGEPGPWHERLPHFRMNFTPSAGAELQSEYLVPRRDAVEAIRALQRLADRIAPVLMIGEVRTMTGDDHWLSPAHGGDTVGLHFTWHPDQPAVEEVLAELERELPASARPHWGKLFVMDPDRIRGLYPRWDDFVALREECDPHGALRNDYTERLGL